MTYDVKNNNQGETTKIIIKINGEATGIVNVEINDENYSNTIVDSTVEILIPNLDAGHYQAKISYSGDERFKSEVVNAEFNVMGSSDIVVSDITC